MSSRATTVLIQPVAVIGVVLGAFYAFNDAFRQFETVTSVALLRLLGVAPGAVQVRPDSSFAVYPTGTGPFLATVTASCSSLSSLLAVAFLAMFTPRRHGARRLVAVACALLCVLVGNIVRIAGSIGIGLAAGTGSLVLFHDWVGSLFAFGYTLGGYLLMLFMLLPARRPAGADRSGPESSGPTTSEVVEAGARVV